MNEKQTRDILTDILRSTVGGIAVDRAVPDSPAAVYRLARKHSLAHLVVRYAAEGGMVPEPELAARMQREDILRLYKHERMKYAFSEACAAFDAARIDHIPLKGAVLRDFYPDESMRTSCDIDILVREEDLDRAVECLAGKGWRVGERHFHDISLFSPNGTHLELHFSVMENIAALDAVLKDAWDYAQPKEGSRWEFRREFFVFHIYAHMAYHFLDGGCGIRSLLDIWVMEHRMGAAYPCAERLLKRAGLWRFASEISAAANRCFTEGDSSDPLLDYIWRGGVYGTRQNRISLQTRTLGSTRAYLLRRIFPPLPSMVIGYPVLGRMPFLLPLCWVHRCFRAAFGRRAKRLRTELTAAGQVSGEELREANELLLRLGL